MEKVVSHPRGALYFVDIDFKEDAQGVQSGNRPCVVISSDAGNSSCDSVVIALITSKEKGGKGINVPFINWNGDENIVLCNQLHTVSKKWLSNKCFGMMPKSIMKEIDKQLSVALSTSRNTVDISDITQAVTRIIELKQKEIENNSQPITQKAVSEIAEQLEKLFVNVLIPMDREAKAAEAISIKEEVKESAPILSAYSEAKATEIVAKAEETPVNVKNEQIKDTKNPDKKEVKRKPKGFWNEENMKKFIKDKEDLPISEVKNKWGIDNSKTIYQMYYRFKKDLGIL